MERLRNRLTLLLELTAGLAEQMELQAIADFVLDVGLQAIDANRGTLCLITPDERWLDVTAHAGYDDDVMNTWSRFAVDAPLPASDAVRSQTPVFLHSPAERAERYPMFAHTGGDGASAMLPLIVRGHALGAVVFGFDGARDFDADDRSFLAALTGQCAIALDRAHLYEAALRRQANLALLAEASAALAAAGDDLDDALTRLAHLVAPAVADIASFHVLESPKSPRLAARAFSDDELTSAIQRVSDYGANLSASEGLGKVLRTGKEVAWEDGELFIEQIARSAEHRQALLDMNLGGGIIVPMRGRAGVLGACVFANHRHRLMTDENRELARDLGERAAVLLDNARLMRQRLDISTGLQAALLPPSLPAIPGFELAARYQPAGEGMDVGGDFYDVVPTGPREWLLVVGDVTGHGVEAAATTGLVRHTIRSAAAMGMRPSQILEHANSALRSRDGQASSETYCTVALAALTTGSDDVPRIVVSCAGHPSPLLRRADSSVMPIECNGRLLGYFAEIEADEVAAELQPGDTLVAFTDGLIERHDNFSWFRQTDLVNLLQHNDLHADALAALIQETVVKAFSIPLADDMALLVLQRLP